MNRRHRAITAGSRPASATLCSLIAAVWLAAAAVLSGCAEPPEKARWLGLNAQLGHPDYDRQWASAKTTELDRRIYFDFMTELGVPMVRDLVMSWARVQPQPQAKHDFSLADDLVRRAQAAQIDLLALCWGIPRWAAAGAGTGSVDLGVPARQHEAAFVAFVSKFVERYDGDGLEDMPGLRRPLHTYEFMNEMEDVPTGEYAHWLKLFYETARKADPRVQVLLGSLRSPGIKLVEKPDGDYNTYFERLLSEPELDGSHYPCFDVVSFHNYPASYPGRGEFADALAYLRRTMAGHNLSLPIWLTEYGYNSGTREEQRQADNIVKWAIKARSLGVDRVYLHGLWDYHWPGDTGAGENVGLVREVPSGQVPPKKPAFRAFAFLLRELESRPIVSRKSEGYYMLSGKGDPCFVLWKEDVYDPPPISFPGWWEMQILNDRPLTKQGPTLKLTDTPLFLRRVQSPFIK